MRNIIAGVAAGAATLVLVASTALSQEPELTEFPIGFVDLVGDPRFDPDYAYNFVPVRPSGPAFEGAELGIADAVQIGLVIGSDFTLRRASGEAVEELTAAVEGWVAVGVHFVIADLAAAELLQLVDSVADLPVTIMNVSASEDHLRNESCRAGMVHTIPSYRMLTDALVQFLVTKRWTRVLVLQGPSEMDQAVLEAVQVSARNFGANIVDVRPILLSNDPREREAGNMALATAGANYDVAYVIDMDGEFARFHAPYQTNDPRPVVGSSGLVPLAWHWSWERSGAPQLNARFEAANGRRMASTDWAAWVAARSIVTAVLRGQSTEYSAVREFLLSDQMNVDGNKGFPMSYRPWNNQLRQGIVLATGNAIIELAPLERFIHQFNDLDTLGVDVGQTACRF